MQSNTGESRPLSWLPITTAHPGIPDSSHRSQTIRKVSATSTRSKRERITLHDARVCLHHEGLGCFRVVHAVHSDERVEVRRKRHLFLRAHPLTEIAHKDTRSRTLDIAYRIEEAGCSARSATKTTAARWMQCKSAKAPLLCTKRNEWRRLARDPH
jgi:hypothetical protein